MYIYIGLSEKISYLLRDCKISSLAANAGQSTNRWRTDLNWQKGCSPKELCISWTEAVEKQETARKMAIRNTIEIFTLHKNIV